VRHQFSLGHPISLGPLSILSPSITRYFKWSRYFRFPHLHSVCSFLLPHSCYKRSASHPPSYRCHRPVSFCGCCTARLIGSSRLATTHHDTPRLTTAHVVAADTAHSALPSLCSTQQQFGACYTTIVVLTVRPPASLRLQCINLAAARTQKPFIIFFSIFKIMLHKTRRKYWCNISLFAAALTHLQTDITARSTTPSQCPKFLLLVFF